MRRSGRLFIILGAGLGLIALGLVAVVLLAGGDDNGDEPTDTAVQEEEEPTEITVIVAARDVPAHTILTAEDLREEVLMSDEVADDALRSTVEAIGFSYAEDLLEGQPLVESQREQPGLANRVDPGRRALPLLATPLNLLGGQLRDDDHVDVVFSISVELQRINPTYPLEMPDNLQLSDIEGSGGEEGVEGGLEIPGVILPEYGQEPPGPTYPYPGEPGSRFWLSDIDAGEPVGKLVLQNVRVLRVITPTLAEGGTQGEEESYVVLDLDPVQAELVQYLSNYGTYQFILRNPEDDDTATTPGITLNSLVDNWGLVVPKTVRLPQAGAQ